MIEWLNSHGLLVLGLYYLVISILGTMPELPPTATYYQKWAYAAAHTLCGNVQKLASMFQQKPQPPKEG